MHLGDNLLSRLVGDSAVLGSSDVVQKELESLGRSVGEEGGAVDGAQCDHPLRAGMELAKP